MPRLLAKALPEAAARAEAGRVQEQVTFVGDRARTEHSPRPAREAFTEAHSNDGYHIGQVVVNVPAAPGQAGLTVTSFGHCTLAGSRLPAEQNALRTSEVFE